MDLKKVLNSAADALGSGQLAWTQDEYVVTADYEYIKTEDLKNQSLSTCAACAVGACALVAVLTGEVEVNDHGRVVHHGKEGSLFGFIEQTLRDQLAIDVDEELINFNDEAATSGAEVAAKLRELADRL